MTEQTTDLDKVLEDRIRSETAELVKLFDRRVAPERIEQEMSAAVSRFRSASVKDFVPLLASRHARMRLEAIASVATGDVVEEGAEAEAAPLP